jgi:maltodextrin utilization protein YvdJ
MADKIKLARYRNTSYFLKYDADGSNKQYTWAGSRGGKVDVKEVPKEVVEWLQMNSICFDKGELVIVDDNEETKEVKDGIVEIETYENNTHSKDEIEKLINGNFMKMKSALAKITVDSEKNFVIEVASEMKDDLTKGKIDFLSDWMGVDSSILFD